MPPNARRRLDRDDQFVIVDPDGVVAEHPVFGAVAPIGGDDLAAVMRAAKDADNTVRDVLDAPDDRGLDVTVFERRQPYQCPLAERQFVARRADQPKRQFLVIFQRRDRPHQRRPVRIAARSLDRQDIRVRRPTRFAIAWARTARCGD